MIIHFATVEEVSADSYKVKFIGDSTVSQTKYIRVSTYTPVKDDKVAILEDDKGKYINIGKVVS